MNWFMLSLMIHSRWERGEDGVLRYKGRLSFFNVEELRNRIIVKSHGSIYYINLGSTKMYHDLIEVFLQEVLKRDIEKFVAKFQNFKQVKAEHQNPSWLLQEIQVPTWKWKDINMHFVVSLPRTQSNMTPYGLLWIG